MAYFFTLYLRAKVSELPWLIGAVLVGTLCSYVWSAFVLPDRPKSVMRESIRSLRARMAIVVDTTAETVRAGELDERRRRQLRIRTGRLNETALMVQGPDRRQSEPGSAVARGERRGPRPVVVRRRTHRRAPGDGPRRPGRNGRYSRRRPRRAGRHGGPAVAGHPDTAPRRASKDRGAGGAAVRADVISRRLAGAPPHVGDNRHRESDC